MKRESDGGEINSISRLANTNKGIRERERERERERKSERGEADGHALSHS